MEFNESEFLIETIVPQNELIVSRTDLTGRITYVNDTFAKISGYEENELIGKPHNVVRHPDMPKRIFSQMWESLKITGRWEGIVKNLRKDKGFYWVHAIISGVYKDGVLVEYKSIRTPIDYSMKLKYQKLYDAYKNIDKDTIRVVSYK